MDTNTKVGDVSEPRCLPACLRNPCMSLEPLTKDECTSLLIQDGTALSEIQNAQMDLVIKEMNLMDDGLPKYVHLMNLYEQNESLFYYILINKLELCMPIIYTPVVGLACQNFSDLIDKPKGLYIKITDKGNISQVLKNWPNKDIKAICVTDGERILGLGDLGANGMGIPIGKLMLYTTIAHIPPQNLLPITLDVGTNNEEFLEKDSYKGLKKRRVTGVKYEQFMDEFMVSVVNVFSEKTLIQFEDFGNQNAFMLLERYRDKYCCFNDDIQGTASVTLSGLLTACTNCEMRLGDCTILMQGAGEAALGIANLLFKTMMLDGITAEAARAKIFLFDSKGLVVKNRAAGGLTEHKLQFAQECDEISNLEEAVDSIKPNVLIGVAAQAKAFTTSILEKMADYHKRPIIFALSNPTKKAECTAADAYKATKGKCFFASGSPFDEVVIKKKHYLPSQCNNAYIFPAVALATIVCQIQPITDGFFMFAAKALSKQVTLEETKMGLLFPSLSRVQEVTQNMAVALVKYAYKYKLAKLQPEPLLKEKFISNLLYNPEYKCLLRVTRD